MNFKCILWNSKILWAHKITQEKANIIRIDKITVHNRFVTFRKLSRFLQENTTYRYSCLKLFIGAKSTLPALCPPGKRGFTFRAPFALTLWSVSLLMVAFNATISPKAPQLNLRQLDFLLGCWKCQKSILREKLRRYSTWYMSLKSVGCLPRFRWTPKRCQAAGFSRMLQMSPREG